MYGGSNHNDVDDDDNDDDDDEDRNVHVSSTNVERDYARLISVYHLSIIICIA